MNKRLGCLTGSGLISGILTLVIVTGLILTRGYRLFSPGALNDQVGDVLGGYSSHAQIGGDCAQCHTAPWEASGMSDQCKECHTVVASQLLDNSSLHGVLFTNNIKLTCQNCHPEHNGPTAPLTVLSGLKFPHDSFGFSLKAHKGNLLIRPVECIECHANNFSKIDVIVCGTCHLVKDIKFTQTHIDEFGPDCLACHDGLDTYGREFNHDLFPFSLGGKHDKVSCSQCHNNQHSIPELKSTSQDCFACHQKDDTHQGGYGNNCKVCHSSSGWKPTTLDHDSTKYILEGKHVDVPCEKCHLEGVLAGTPKDCQSCHSLDDIHEGRFGIDCASCHTTIGWKPADFDHNLSLFKLDGKHVDTACNLCHIEGVYKGTPSDCFTCHVKDDKHKGSLGRNCGSCHFTYDWVTANFNHSLSFFKLTGKHVGVDCQNCHLNGVYKGTPSACYGCHTSDDRHNGSFGFYCENCHGSSGWSPATFDHSQSSFKLTGKHVTVGCEGCHTSGIYQGTPSNCYACHASNDKHNGGYGKNCNTCHSESGWLPATFDHSLASFKLTGKHISVSCQGCHTNGIYQGTPTNCYSCHASNDKHKGAYGTNCENCHATSGWLPAVFDHSLATFKLTGQHVNVACQGCHVNGVYQGTPTNCYGCHISNDKHKGAYGTNCENCHATSGWLPAAFDHSLASFKLTGKHVSVACQDCHVNGVYQGTPTNCYACHASNDKHNGSYGTNCDNCHSTSGWLPATFDHSLSKFKLTGKHANVTCQGCHVNGVYQGTPTNCYACHASSDKHNGSYGTTCDNCHSTSGWLPANFDHSQSTFKLTGKHVNVACQNCHVNGVYKGTPSACVACHAEPAFHSGTFGTNCDQCHTTSNWDATYSGSHPTIDGKNGMNHENATCKDCHTVNLSTATCTECHDNNNPN
jgi:hypothetical protein